MLSDRDHAINFIAEACQVLAKQEDLSPDNGVVTELLQLLVAKSLRWCDRDWAFDLPDDPALHEESQLLPALCGKAEALMEKWWARRLLGRSALEMDDLQSFWYFRNYLELVDAECTLLPIRNAAHVTLIGSGALPLTALLLHHKFGVRSIVCVDQDDEANELSQELILRLSCDRSIHVHEQTAIETKFESGTHPICASLVSADDVFPALYAQAVPRFILRDVEGLFRFFYRPKALHNSDYIVADRTRNLPGTINMSKLMVLAASSGASAPTSVNNQ